VLSKSSTNACSVLVDEFSRDIPQNVILFYNLNLISDKCFSEIVSWNSVEISFQGSRNHGEALVKISNVC